MRQKSNIVNDLKSLLSLVPYLIIFLIFISLAFVVPYYFGFYGEDDAGNKAQIVQYQTFYYCLSLVFTMVLIAVAYIQLKGVRKRMESDFLLEIDRRWGNAESLKARTIIHKMIVKSEETHGMTNSQNFVLIMHDVQGGIIDLRKGKDDKSQEEFMIVLNFLEFMETIGYLAYSDCVSEEALDKLCGHSISFNYMVFKLYIESKSKRHEQNDFYKHFKALHENLEKKKNAIK